MDLVPLLSVVVAVVALIVAALAMVSARNAHRSAQESRRDYSRIANADQDVVDVLLDRISEIDVVTRSVEELSKKVKETRDELGQSLRHVAVLRYDAYGDQTGRRSFSVAVIDDSGDGFIISSLHSRAESQTFAKGVTGGHAKGLSPEETEALRFAKEGGTA